MPRKGKKKTEKAPLLFLEQPAPGSRLKHEPEVRLAENPKEFFNEETSGSGSALRAWVSPQFDRSVLAALPARRGRRRCQSAAASVLDGGGGGAQPSRKVSVCRYPTLSFQTRLGENQPKNSKNKPKKSAKHGLVQPPPATPPPADVIAPPPDVETPEFVQEENRNHLHRSLRLLLDRRSTPSPPPCDTLVDDTPEREYGVKVTWRRRKGVMETLRQRGHLSESDTLIQKI
ncbi:unnamed protein product [Ophioblennius macclurei]